MSALKVTSLISCDPNKVPLCEDAIVINHTAGVFAALDGLSRPSCLNSPAPKYSEWWTGGQMVVHIATHFLGLCPRTTPLDMAILAANQRVAEFLHRQGTTTQDAGKLPAATIAAVKIAEKEVEVVQAGDAYVVWRQKDGLTGTTRNQVRNHDTLTSSEIARLMAQIQQESGISPADITSDQLERVRAEMWNRFFGFLTKIRRENMNNPDSPNGFGVINGQPQLRKMLARQTLPRKALASIIAFTDGMLFWNEAKDQSDEELARDFYELYSTGGLPAVLAAVRTKEKKYATSNYVTHSDAAAVAVEF